MAGVLTTDVVLRGVDRLTAPFNSIANKALATHARVQSALSKVAGAAPMAGMGSAAMASGVMGMVRGAQDFNQAIWGVNAAFLGSADAAMPMDQKIAHAKEQTQAMRIEALALSKVLGLMPEEFAKAGEEAAKMGLTMEKAKAVMKVAGMVQMSDRDAKAPDIAKALGTYGIQYGAEEDPAAYAAQVKARASMMALAGALTRTSASKLEEGMRNYAGMQSAFGGKFEDAVALIASMTQSGQMEKEAGTALKSLQGRFLRMPAEGRAAISGAGIDLSKFMDFSAVAPTRATNQLMQMFPQQLQKGARGNISKFLEAAEKSGRLKDPEIINETLRLLEKQGLKFAGAEDRDIALGKITSIMTGAGGKFDMMGLFAEVNRAITEGRGSTALMGLLGEPKRLHQYAALLKMTEDAIKLRDRLKGDGGDYLDTVAAAFKESDAAKLTRFESSMRRLQLAFVKNDGIAHFMDTIGGIAEKLESANPKVMSMAAWGAVAGIIAGPAMLAARGLLALGGAGLVALRGIGWLAAWPFMQAAGGLRALALGMGMIGMAGTGGALTGLAKFVGIVGRLAAIAAGGLALGALYTFFTQWQEIASSPEVARLSEAFGNLVNTMSDLGSKFMGLFGIDAKGSPLLTGILLIVDSLAKMVGWLDAAMKYVAAPGKQVAASGARLKASEEAEQQRVGGSPIIAVRELAAELRAQRRADGKPPPSAEEVAAQIASKTLTVRVENMPTARAATRPPRSSNAHEGDD